VRGTIGSGRWTDRQIRRGEGIVVGNDWKSRGDLIGLGADGKRRCNPRSGYTRRARGRCGRVEGGRARSTEGERAEEFERWYRYGIMKTRMYF